MDRVDLGPLRVSRLCLGTMLMGGRTPPDEAQRMLDAYVAAGHNFLDTADVYGDGTSEQTLAPWLARRRDEVVVATKVRFAVSDPGGAGLAPERICAACDASLRRLGIDVIDLYQLHAPDPDVALEDTLEALDGLVRAGKVRALGASNFPAWLLAWAVARPGPRGPLALRLAAAAVLARRALDRDRDPALLPRRRARGPSVGPARCRLPHRPLRARAAPPAGTRIGDAEDDLEEALHRRGTEANFRAVDEARAVADELGASVAQVAIAWLLAQPGVTAPILGPRTLEQLEDLLPAARAGADRRADRRLGRLTAPPRGYPERMNIEQNAIDVGTSAAG